jgi:nucleoside-diphosphate-sugar epimerase
MSAYGSISVPLVTEDTPPDAPDAYGRAKRDAEDLLAGCVAQGLPSGLAIRLPGTVGRGSHHNFLSDVLGRVLRAEPVQARHPAALFNNIVEVGDLAAFLGDWVADPRPGYHLTNLAADAPLPIREVFSLLYACAGRPAQVSFTEDGKASFLISLDRAVQLGYRPATVRASIEAFVRESLAP